MTTPYHYRLCGLEDVWLVSGFRRKRTRHGVAVAVHDVPGLHRAIAGSIVMARAPLAGQQLRFLRKEMGLSQAELANRLGLDTQTVARYEKGESDIHPSVDRLMRFLAMQKLVNPKERIAALVALMEKPESAAPLASRFRSRLGNWTPAASSRAAA